MHDPIDDQSIAKAFKALGDGNRLRIFQLIAEEDDICACHILEAFDFTQPTLSHHVKILCEADLVLCRKDGRWMHYSINRDMVKAMREWLADNGS